MSTNADDRRTVIVEREIPFPLEKIWRALTQPHLIEEWLMKNDFKLEKDQKFTLRDDWGSVECKILNIEPNRSLSYSWEAMGLESVVTWTLTPTGTGTKLRMEQSGFRPDQERAFLGAQFGWKNFFSALESLLQRET